MKRLILIGLLVVIIFIAACVQQPLKEKARQEFKVSLESVSSSCASEQENSISLIQVGDELLFEGVVITPNPCQDLELKDLISGDKATISVITVPKDGICIQCIGAVSFSGKISGAEDKTLEFRYNNKIISAGNAVNAK